MTLTPEERAAIEAFTGSVKRIPRGTSGLPDLRWCDKSNHIREINDDETFVNRKQALERGKRRFFQRNGTRPVSPLAASRKAFVQENYQTMTVMEMSRALGCDKGVVTRIVKVLGITPKRANRTADDMRAAVKKAMAGGAENAQQVADIIKADWRVAARYMKELNQ